jgi:hypothetical protein
LEGIVEKKLSPNELKRKLVEYHRSMPVVMDGRDFEERMKDTVVSRYQRGTAAAEEVKALLLAAAGERGLSKDMQGQLKKSVKKVDDAITLLAYGYFGYNKAARGRFRPVLWPGDKKYSPR